ncbi:MAG: chitosanase [Acidimicrobiia bacterium]
MPSTSAVPPSDVPTTGSAAAPTTVASVPVETTTAPPSTTAAASGPLSPDQRRRADELISTFENSTTELQYGYASELGDGRGITAGRAGFTSATGDLELVVEKYVALVPSTPLAAFLPELKRLAADRDPNTAGLTGFVAQWEQASTDPLMRTSQDAIVDQLYFGPAMARGQAVGLQTALALTAVYDTAIQHGDGDDPDSLQAIIGETTKRLGGSPSSGIDERAWLTEFLAVRRRHLLNAAQPATRAAWRESVGRVDALQSLVKSGNLDLTGPFSVTVYGDRFTIA